MRFFVLTLFPEMINDGLNHSILKRAMEAGLLSVEAVNIRDFANNKHNRVDDYPYGGGAGMVMQPGPVFDACTFAKAKAGESTRVVYLTPQGKPFKQAVAREFSKEETLILLCGHYEGIDERVIEEIVTDEVSLGDFVLTGGELAAMVLIDATARLVPGVLSEGSPDEESFSEHELGVTLEYPQYTRPYEFHGKTVPEVLLSGHHKNVEEWRTAQSLARTKVRRPDLLEKNDDTENGCGHNAGL